MTAEPIRVLLVDDHAVVREGTAELLERAGGIQVVGQEGSGTEAVRAAAELQPDVLLLDLALPGLDGLDVARRVREVSPGTAIVVLSAHEERAYVLAALDAGASGYVTKAARGEEVVDAVRAVASGQTALSPRIAAAVVHQALDRSQPTDKGAALTPREMEVLRAVARGLANKQVAAELGMSERTVQTHLTHIFSKLGVASRTEAVLYAVRMGWAPSGSSP